MGIESGFYSRLSSSTSLTNLVGTRIYPGYVPDGEAYPHIRFMLRSSEQNHHIAGHDALHESTFQVDCYTEDNYLSLTNIGENLRKTLNSGSTTFGTFIVRSSHVEVEIDEPPFQPQDGSDKWVFGRSFICRIFYHST